MSAIPQSRHCETPPALAFYAFARLAQEAEGAGGLTKIARF